MDTGLTTIFFYGLFMDESLLALRGIRPDEVSTGYVEGFRLSIGERATLRPEANSRVYGVQMRIAPDAIDALYSEDSVADYVSEKVIVNLPGNGEVVAVCYNLPCAKMTETNPEYAAALLSLATRLGFPDSYLEQIRTMATGS